MFFYKEYNFTTEYSKEEIRNILKEMKKPSDKRTWRFDGTVVEDEFTLLPLFYPNLEHNFRPELHGAFMENASGNKLILKIRIPSSFKILFYIMIFFNALVGSYLIYLGKSNELIIGLIMGFIFFIFILVAFHQIANRAIQILITKLKLKKI